MSSVISFDSDKCIGCGLCAKDCPLSIIAIENKKACMRDGDCLECGHCLAICPQNAVLMKGYDMSEVKEIDTLGDIEPNAFFKSMLYRRTVRSYKDIPVEKAKIEQIIEVGRYTPTGINLQNVRYIVMKDPTSKVEPLVLKKLARILKITNFLEKFGIKIKGLHGLRATEGLFFYHAPVIILLISNNVINASLAAANMEKMAQSLGLGVMYAGMFARIGSSCKDVRKFLKLKKNENIVTGLCLGYPNVKYQRSVPRKKANVEWM